MRTAYSSRSRIGVVAHVSEADVIRVGIEDHDAEARIGEHALEEEAEGVGLAGSGLADQKRVPAEASAVEDGWDTRGVHELTDSESGAARAGSFEPRADLRGRGWAGTGVVERPPVGVEDAAGPGRQPEDGVEPQPADSRRGCRHRRHREIGDLAEARCSVALEHHVAPARQLETVQRGLKGEGRPVHRGGERQNVAFQLLASATVGGEVVRQCFRRCEWLGHGSSVQRVVRA